MRVTAGRGEWTADERGARALWVLDAMAGRPPVPADQDPEWRPRFAFGLIGVRAVLWAALLGALAPATTGLVMLAGLADDDAGLVDSTDIGFFFGFVPLLMAVVVVLVALNHWPLTDVRSFHRELAVALFAVGVVVLVKLRIHGGDVTDPDWHDAWLTVNGSLVLHALVLYWLVRLAIRDLAGLHVEYAGESVVFERYEGPVAPTREALMGLAVQAFLWGVMIAALAGAAAGTLLVPVLGTLVGAYFGALYGLVPTVFAAAWLLVTVLLRHDLDAANARRTIDLALGAVGVTVMVGLWPFLQSATFRPDPWEDANLARVWVLVLPVVLLLLRKGAARLGNIYTRLATPPPIPLPESGGPY